LDCDRERTLKKFDEKTFSRKSARQTRVPDTRPVPLPAVHAHCQDQSRKKMKLATILAIIIGAIIGTIYLTMPAAEKPDATYSMFISSPAFKHNGLIPKKYTCDGGDINPPLYISGVPASATKSLALIVDDPDAPVGTWVHWTLWNITPQTAEIPENSAPLGAFEGTTDFGRPGYGGPCPPSGTHRYFFKLYALDILLTLPSTARKADVEKAMQGHIMDKAELIGLYKRI